MKKNLYYHAVFRRSNPVKEFFLSLFTFAASPSRMLLEVFLRRNFGERYFSFAQCVLLAIVLGILPIIPFKLDSYYSEYGNFGDVIERYFDVYVFLMLFLGVAYYRKLEIQQSPSVFDFGRFSLSAGDMHSNFSKLKIFKDGINPKGPRIGPSPRQISIILEPALCALIGLFLIALSSVVGALLVIASIFYAGSYVAAYNVGDNFVMDKIDELICNQELYNSFVDGVDPSKTRGVNYYGRRPADPETRRTVADMFLDDDDEAVDAM